MLNAKDVAMLRGMFGELLEANNHVLKCEIRDEMHSLIRASENRLRKEILDGVADIVGGSILPQIDDLDRRVTRLETAQSHA